MIFFAAFSQKIVHSKNHSGDFKGSFILIIILIIIVFDLGLCLAVTIQFLCFVSFVIPHLKYVVQK